MEGRTPAIGASVATQKYDALSNASTGFFRPILQPDGSLIAYEYSGEGLQPVRVQPQVQQDLGGATGVPLVELGFIQDTVRRFT